MRTTVQRYHLILAYRQALYSELTEVSGSIYMLWSSAAVVNVLNLIFRVTFRRHFGIPSKRTRTCYDTRMCRE